MGINRTIRRVLKAFSAEEVNLKEARRKDNLRAISFTKPFHIKENLVVENEQYLVPVRIFFPNQQSKIAFEAEHNELPVIIYLHGGGWVLGNVDGYERICDKLARYTNSMVISVEYRLAPEYKFPVGLMDCYAVVSAVANETFPHGIFTKNITLMGDSAGGNLTAAICQMARDKGEDLVRKQVLIYPAVNNDYTQDTPYESVHTKGEGYVLTAGQMRDFLEYYENTKEDRRNPYFAPILAKDFGNLPKALIITGENDPLRDEGEDYGEHLKASGVETQIYRISNAVHGYFGMGFNGKWVRKSLYLINRFLKED